MQVLGAGGALGGPARPGVNFVGKTANLGAAPHDWGFAKKHIPFHCTHPQMVSLRRKYAFLFLQTGQDVSSFLHQENNKHLFSFMNLFYFMYRRAVILLD